MHDTLMSQQCPSLKNPGKKFKLIYESVRTNIRSKSPGRTLSELDDAIVLKG